MMARWSRRSPSRGAGARALAALLERVQQRVTAQLAELEQTLQRIEAFREANAAALAGEPDAHLGPPDPRRHRAA
jgi:hypothetical protein